MKVVVVLALVACACASPVEVQEVESPVYGYIRKYGIPLAEKIQKAEEEYLKSGSRIIGGVPAALGQYPYQAGLISDIVGISGRGICGGTVISSMRILTAAHCWNDGANQAWRFEVVLGSVLLFTGGTRVHTSAIVMHPNWNPNLARNDVGVIYLPNAITFTASIAPIALPSGAELNNNFAGASAIAIGYGITRDGQSITTGQSLNHVRLNVITNTVCSVGHPFLIQSTNVCTSGIGGNSICSGDSGGPLVVEINGRSIQIGISSFVSVAGCESGLPAVYARVSSFISFINQHNV